MKKHFREAPKFSGFPGELRQVFDNLVENAMDAVGPDGLIWIRVRARGHGAQEKVTVSVLDNGAGMSTFVMARIFDPFFTTKPQTGSGLGLWVTRGIVRNHGGTIRTRSCQGEQRHGTVFTITFPVERRSGSEQPSKSNSVHAV